MRNPLAHQVSGRCADEISMQVMVSFAEVDASPLTELVDGNAG